MKIEKFCKEIERILRENSNERLSFTISYYLYEFSNYQRQVQITVMKDRKGGEDPRIKDFFHKKFKNEKKHSKP